MVIENYQYHACGRKTPFMSRGEARQSATNNGGQTKPYRCPFEDHWHLGHSRSKKARRILHG